MQLRWRWFTGEGQLVYRLLLAVDLERYSRLDAHQQLAAQTDLRGLLDGCAKRTGLRTNAWYRQPGGDGELVVLPAGVNVARVVGAFAHDLERALTELNSRAGDPAEAAAGVPPRHHDRRTARPGRATRPSSSPACWTRHRCALT
ncbi:hypothetical protein [Actinomadura madurae]|uniref:hypothetical protein n=1 Tax=Actinomadura madurae TaxID=1993 RepID=UPI0020D249AC|nr:hypothetical protein [Actinomadura madurae]MCQ0018347.1 hypothetical protein [Actinomadura madurae]